MSNPFRLSRQALTRLELEPGDVTLATFNDAIDQILKEGTLDGDSAPFTDDSLATDLPEVLTRVLKFGSFENERETVVSFLAKVAGVFRWSFVRGSYDLAEKMRSVFNERVAIYVRNQASQLWNIVVSRFLEEESLELMLAKSKENPDLLGYHMLFTVFHQVSAAMQSKTSMDLAKSLLEGFALFLESSETQEEEGMRDAMMDYISLILNQARCNFSLTGTGFIAKHVRSVMRVAPMAMASQHNSGLALEMLNELLKSEQPEIFMEMSNCLIDNSFFAELAKKDQYDVNANMLLANFGTLMSPQYALEMWSNTQAQIIKDVVTRYERGQLRHLLSIADKNSPNLADLLLSVASNYSSSNIESAREVITYIVTELDVSEVGMGMTQVFSVMPQGLRQQIYAECVEHMTENANCVHMACRLIESHPQLVTDDLVEYVMESMADGAVDFFPLFETIVIKTEKVISAVQAELMVCCCGDELWKSLSAIVRAKGVRVFDAGTETVFMNVGEKTKDYKDFVQLFVKSRSGPSQYYGQQLIDFPMESLPLLEHAFENEFLLHLPGKISNRSVKPFVEYIVQRFNEGFLNSDDVLKAVKLMEQGSRLPIVRHQAMTPPNHDLPLSVQYRFQGKEDTFTVRFTDTQTVGDVLANIGTINGCVMDQCELYVDRKEISRTVLMEAFEIGESTVIDVAGTPRMVAPEQIPSCILMQMGLTTILMKQMKEGDESPYELLEYLETDHAVAEMVEKTDDFVTELVSANRASYCYLMKTLISRRFSQVIKEAYIQTKLGEIVEQRILGGQVLGVDLAFLHAFGVDVTDDVILKLIHEMASVRSVDYHGCLLILDQYVVNHMESLRTFLFGDSAALETLISACPNELWTQLKSLLLSLRASQELYELFLQHQSDGRYIQLFVAVVDVLISLEEDDKVFDDCLNILSQTTEKDSLRLLNLMSQRMSDSKVAEPMCRRLLDMATTTEVTVMRKKIYDMVFSSDLSMKEDYLWDLARWKSDKMDHGYEGMYCYYRATSSIVNLSGNHQANTIIQQLFNMKPFKTFVFATDKEPDTTAVLKRCFAFMEKSKETTVDISEIDEHFGNVDFYCSKFPGVISRITPEKNTELDLSSCVSSCVIVDVNGLTKPSIPERIGDSYALSGVITASMNGKPISVIRRGESICTIGESCVQSMSDDSMERLLSMRRLKPLTSFYVKVDENQSQITIPAELLQMVKEKNDRYLKEKCIFSRDVCDLMLVHSTPEQWMSYFFNVYLRTNLVQEAESAEQKNEGIEIGVTDIMQFADVIPMYLQEIKNDMMRKCLVELLTRVVRESSVESGRQITDLVANKVNRSVVPILEEFCRKGQAAVEYCDSLSVGEQLCELALQMNRFANASEIFELLTYFPVHEIAGLMAMKQDYASGYMNGNMEALERLFIFSSFSGIVSLDDLGLEPTDEKVMNVVLTLLKRGMFNQIVAFMEEHDVAGEVASNISDDFGEYEQLFVSHPIETVVSLLSHAEWQKMGENVMQMLSESITPEVRESFIDVLLKYMNETDDKTPFLIALRQLGYLDGTLIVDLLEREKDSKAIDILLEMAGSVEAEMHKYFGMFLRVVKEGHLLQLKFLVHMVSDDMAEMEDWNEIANQLRENEPELSKLVLARIWDLPSFKQLSISVLKRPDQYVDEETLPYILRLEACQDHLDFLVAAMSSFMEKDVETGVSEIGGKIIRECSALDYKRVFVDIPALFTYIEKHGCDESVVGITKLVASQNSEFDTLLRDDIETQIQRNKECPHVVEVKMRLYATSIEDIESIYKDAVARLIDCTCTVGVLFDYFICLGLPAERLTIDLFSLSPLAAKNEVALFRDGMANMTPEAQSSFAEEYAQSVNPLNPKPADMRRLRFLIKNCDPSLKDQILKKAGIDRKRALFLAGVSSDMRKSCAKIFDLKPEELTETKPIPRESARPIAATQERITPYFLVRPAVARAAAINHKALYGTPRYARE